MAEAAMNGPRDNAPEAHILVERLTKDFPGAGGARVRAVNDVSFAVGKGEWLALVGPSGSGKTTLLRLVAGLEEATSGTISVDGRCVNGMAARDRNLAMVSQHAALYPHLSASENMAFGLRIRRVARKEVAERVRAAAAALGLEDCLGRKPAALSGGQRQRVALGRALVRRPKLLLLDEPLSNLDAHTRCQLRTELLRLREKLATTVIYVTHDQQEAMTVGTRLGVLRNGTLQQIGSARELFERPANMFVAGFLGTPPMNLLAGTLNRGRAGLVFRTRGEVTGAVPIILELTDEAVQRMEPWVDKSVVLGIRPEQIRLAGAGEQGLEGLVEAVEDLGADKHVHLRSGGERIVVRVSVGEPLQAHGKVTWRVEMKAAHFFRVDTEAVIP